MRIDPFNLISAQSARVAARPPEPQASVKPEFSRLEFPKAADTSPPAQGFVQPDRLGVRLNIKV